ncbi:MAG TPA: helix-turn-helix domain-containing protein [Cyclobacteriaceae bacterium]|jgi:AraC-like DNA-binding protein|nr:helix-turn-helix domain-containing protein [Cytophagales bacterium]HMR56830.1 helix-turn-helix domain-containing protein [Cyclobacteriaceae bacterium]HNT51029.1 helix-turn-helix domain-containing protein [Cyclobacteriaceae bacterium]HRE66100.1 helix-turn-helix domain-containing protein [Cyclobacteriaceae bacterium]HRF32209.1 helix-turn-helix domain-containing protein [Cyclobacteriaceae bacterium]
MKVIPFQVPKTEQEAFRLQIDRLPYFYDRLHQHKEIQIMLIEKGEGTLIAGDYVGRFTAGEVYLIGSGQPHVFRCDENYYHPRSKKKVQAVSLYFDKHYMGESFWHLNEVKDIHQFLLRLGTSRAEDILQKEVSELIQKISSAEKTTRLILFLQLLTRCAQSKKLKSLSVAPINTGTLDEDKRMNDVLQFTFRQSHRKIKISEAASIANLSGEAFCRYFKVRTRKTYTNFLNEVRISQACKMLIEGNFSIQSICFDSGFQNLSHFNRQFKKVTGKTPSRYIQTSRAVTG